jgi:serine/threonine-protein kinase
VTDGVAQSVKLLAGRYEVGELIGRGGMADVHVGTDTRLGRHVAIKLLRADLAADPAFRSRFRREAQDAAKMAHPTIVRIFDAGEETILDEATGIESQVPFIIMEFVDGHLLSELIENGPMDPHQAIGIIEQVLTALEYSHRAGLVHRDVKPGNIMITSTGQVKVMDFGIARAITETGATIAETSTIVGTAQYFSPEQARGEAVDARTDLYSTGIVLFEMLAGRAPFVGDNPVAVAYQHVNQQAVRPSVINPRVSPMLDAVVLRSIAKDRAARFQTAAEFRSELASSDNGTVAMKRPVPVAHQAPALFDVDPARTESAEETVRQLTIDDSTRAVRSSQSRPPVAWIWGGVVVVIAIVVAVLYWALNLSTTTFVPNKAIAVPDVVGISIEDASSQFDELGLRIRQVEEPSSDAAAGTVVATTPKSGVTVSPDTEVAVTVSTGPEPVTVPVVSSRSVEDARAALERVGLVVSEQVTTAHSASVDEGDVMASTPSGGESAQVGQAVTLIVSDGKVEIPDVSGQSIGQAETTLTGPDLQLEVQREEDYSCGGSAVSRQSLVGVQKQHATVTLSYCANADAEPTPAPTPTGE